jgi:hypothetical protein
MSSQFDASLDVAYKIMGTLVSEEDELILIPENMDAMSFQCHQLKCARCGENLERKLIDLRWGEKDVFAEDEMLFVGF